MFRRQTFRRRRLRPGTSRRLDFYAPRFLGAKGKKKFFQKKIFFFQKKNFFSKQVFFSRKKVFFKKTFFLQKIRFFSQKNFFLLNDSLFSNKNIFQQKSFTLIKMLLFSKLFIRCLSRRIVRIESAGKGMAIGKSRAVIGWKRIAEIREKNVHIN